MQRLDVTGLISPAPVLRTRRMLAELNEGEVLEVRASDPDGVKDFPAFCRNAGHILRMARQEDDVYVFEIERGPGRHQDPSEADNVIPLKRTAAA